MSHDFEFQLDCLTVIAWPDHKLDTSGHDPRGQYVEKYWLPVLGPSATLLLRRIADELETNPSGFVMDLQEMAGCLGIGGFTGKNAAFSRALNRLIKFNHAKLQSPDTFAVHKRVPSLHRRHVVRLPQSAQVKHDYWLRKLSPV